jgi:hypothetical protein
MPEIARWYLKNQMEGSSDPMHTPPDTLVELRQRLVEYGASGDAADAAARHCLTVRRSRLVKALTGRFPGGMRVGLQELSERLPGAMAARLGNAATLSALLMGPTGCGKTTAAAVLALRCAPVDLHWVYATDLATADRYHKLGQGEPPALEQCRKAKALVLDDIGAEPNPALWTILNHRYHEGLPTIATTGLTRDELSATIGAAAVRRLVEQHAGHEVLIADCHGRANRAG